MPHELHPHTSHAGMSAAELSARVQAASVFHRDFLLGVQTAQGIVHIAATPKWAEKHLRRSASIPAAVLEKISSNSFCKRCPGETEGYLEYLAARHVAQAPLVLRVVVGPVKNAQRYGHAQKPDLAEFLMLVQLSRLVEKVVALYPHGVRMHMVPDDIRGQTANGWPVEYSQRYIRGLQQMVQSLGFASWLKVENGQAALYEQYRVAEFYGAAEEALQRDPDYAQKLGFACEKAKKNFVHAEDSPQAIADSAQRYLVAHKAEVMSGMWSPVDAFPLGYAHHADQFQLFTMGRGLTKLPWQIHLPIESLPADLYAPSPAAQRLVAAA